MSPPSIRGRPPPLLSIRRCCRQLCCPRRRGGRGGGGVGVEVRSALKGCGERRLRGLVRWRPHLVLLSHARSEQGGRDIPPPRPGVRHPVQASCQRWRSVPDTVRSAYPCTIPAQPEPAQQERVPCRQDATGGVTESSTLHGSAVPTSRGPQVLEPVVHLLQFGGPTTWKIVAVLVGLGIAFIVFLLGPFLLEKALGVEMDDPDEASGLTLGLLVVAILCGGATTFVLHGAFRAEAFGDLDVQADMYFTACGRMQASKPPLPATTSSFSSGSRGDLVLVVHSQRRGVHDEHLRLPGRIRAGDTEDVRFLVCLDVHKTLVGRYENGAHAYRYSFEAWLGDLRANSYVETRTIRGSPPPQSIRSGTGTGSKPRAEFHEWIEAALRAIASTTRSDAWPGTRPAVP